MALIAGATNTYLENVTTLNQFFLALKNVCEEQKWAILFYEGLEELIVGNPTGEFCLAFTGFEDFANNIFTMEIECFRDYDVNKSIYTQTLSIPKRGFKAVDIDLYPPQVSVGNSAKNCYLQVTPDFIMGNLVTTSSSDCRAFFAGKFLPYSDSQQYNLPLFVAGDTQTEQDLIVNNTPCEPFTATTNTTSNYMFGRRRLVTGGNFRVSDFLLSPSGEWQRLGILSSSDIDNYPSVNTDSFPSDFDKATVFPCASFLTQYKGSLSGGNNYQKCKLFTKQNDDGTANIVGEVPNVLMVYFDDSSFSPVETVIQIEGEDYIIFRDVYRSLGNQNYYAMKVL